MLHDRSWRWLAAAAFVSVACASPVGAVTLDGTYATRFSFGFEEGTPCTVTVTQAGTALAMSGTGCTFVTELPPFAFSATGSIDSGSGAFSASGGTDFLLCDTPGSFTIAGTSDGETFAGFFTCQTTGNVAGVRLGGPLCGDGAVDPGEECDPGGGGSACCSASCHFPPDGTPCSGSAPCRSGYACSAGTCAPTSVDPPGTACNADGDLCTREACDAGGACVPDGADVQCGPCEECLPSSGCRLAHPRLLAEPGTCGAPVEPSAGLKVADRSVTATASWTLGRGPAIVPGELGDPTTATPYELCLYGVGELGFDPVLAVSAPAGGGWRAVDGGFRFRRDDASGRTVIAMKAGAAGRSRVKFRHKAPLWFPGILNLVSPPFVAELRSPAGPCFGALFDAPRVHTPTRLRATEGRAP